MHGSLITAAVRALSGATAATSPEVITSHGILRGGVCSNQNVQYFHSIPYAEPPTGDLRFAPPKAYTQKYSGNVRNATVSAPACAQFGANWIEGGQNSEDCLYINVWKPAKTNAKSSLPVRVFVHGGGNTGGSISDPMYDGCGVALDNVMVSINYRLGPLGFLALEDAGISGNQGIQDIVMGMQWVQDNIKAFGGNPKQVVLHGQSTGAADAYAVATLDQAPKLMNAFISQSGAGRDLPAINATADAGKNFAKALKCDTKDIKCFQHKPLEDIAKTFGNSKTLKSDTLMAATESGNHLSYGPHIDGKLFGKQPNEVGVRVPSIFGVNADEGTYFAQAYATGQKGLAGTTEKDYEKFLQDHFGANAKKVEQQYPISNFKKTPFPPYFAISQVITDSAFACPANRALKAAADKKVAVWTYNFSHKSHCAWDPTGVPEKDRSYMGATHGAEVPYAFGMTSQLPRPNGNCQMTDDEQKITAFLKQSFTYFAATRKPTKDDNSWPAWSTQKSVGLNLQDSVKPGAVNYTVCKFWDDLHDKAAAAKPKDDGKPQESGKPKDGGSKPSSTSSAPSSSKTATSFTTTSAPPTATKSATTTTSSEPMFPTALGNGTSGGASTSAPSTPNKADPLAGAAAAVHVNVLGVAALALGAAAIVGM